MTQTKKIRFFSRDMWLGCDGNCGKAWGLNGRPQVSLSDDIDDVEWLSDAELGEAPANPGTYEGGHGKPVNKAFNKWCARECERSCMESSLGEVLIQVAKGRWSKRVRNLG